MLITNFAAGELSENLFGRTDIPQYFSGCSRLENFNVIPTGGIERRGGMRRMLELDGDGRLVPFIMNRGQSFLLYLSPNKIKAYKIEQGEIPGEPQIFLSSSNIRLYESLAEIHEVQYAQNYDTMMLVHENYRPLKITIENNSLSIGNFYVSIETEIVAQPGIDKNDFFENDMNYTENNWLRSENNWPGTVTFFLNRLVFAGTKNDPQRLFFSSADNINKFSTYKKFITETREYTVIRGKVLFNTNEIELLDLEDFGKFKKDLYEYHIQSPHFHADAMLAGVIGNKLQVTANAQLVISQGELDAFNEWRDRIDTGFQEIYTFVRYDSVPNSEKINRRALRYAVGSFQTTAFWPGGFSIQSAINLPLEDVQEFITNKDSLYNFVYGRIERFLEEEDANFLEEDFNRFIDDFHGYICENMFYPMLVQGIHFIIYGTPAQIYQQIRDKFNLHSSLTVETFVAFYTKDFIIDSYPTPDCGFTFEIASDSNEAIRWLAVNKGLIVGTEMSEWIIPPGVHANNVQAALNSRYGSDKIQGAVIGDAACFFQTGKKALVEYYIPQQDNNFRYNNLAVLSANMLRESPAVDFDFLASPYTTLVITREDGTAVQLLYERSTGTFAWGRITTEGFIKSCAVVPGAGGYDEVYLIVMRGNMITQNNVVNKFYLEKLQIDSPVFLDSYRLWDGASGYTTAAESFYDETDTRFIGYPYTSLVRSMPILANNKMKQNNIKNLFIRFLESSMPKMKSLPNEKVDTLNRDEPFTGVIKTPFPGVWDHDVMFEFIHDRPNKCKILSIFAEVN